MDRLRDRVINLTKLIPRDRPVIYLDYPVHTNVGDLLIQLGTRRFFEHHDYNVVASRSAYDFCPRAARLVTPETTIVLHGGGNFGDLYDQHQKFRERVIAQFPANRIVMLPQTIHYKSPERLAQSAQVFARHPDLHVCLRDRHSMATFQANFTNSAYLVPDMAHFLWRGFDFYAPVPPTPARSCSCARISKPPVHASPSRVKSRSTGSRSSGRSTSSSSAPSASARQALHARQHLPLSSLWQRYSEHLIDRAVALLHGRGHVVTDRLHMALLGLLMRRRVTFIDNSYGKLSSYVDTWLQHHRDIEMRGGRRYTPARAADQALARAAQ